MYICSYYAEFDCGFLHDDIEKVGKPAKEQFGDDRMLHFLRTCKYESARQEIAAIAADVEQHRQGAEPNDDLTMMCIYIKDTADE